MMMMTPSKSTRCAGIIVFLLIAFGIPWTGWIVLRSTEIPNTTLESLTLFWLPATCSLAGAVASFVEGGTKGLRRFASRVFGLRFSWYLLALALILPLIAGGLTFVTHPNDLSRGGASRLALLGGITTFLANLWTGPVAEEFGWRGYLLPKLAERWNPIVAGLVIGIIWTLWHLPLFYDSVFATASSTIKFLATTTAWSVTLALLVSRAHGSVLPSIVAHWAINSQVIVFHALLPQVPHDNLPGGWGFCVASIVVAALLAWFWRDVRWEPRT